MTPQGFPPAYEVMAGNTSDNTTLLAGTFRGLAAVFSARWTIFASRAGGATIWRGM